MSEKLSGLPEIDFTQEKHRLVRSLTLDSEDRAFLASVATGNATSEAEVLQIGLRLLKTLGSLGQHETIFVSPAGNDDLRTRILLGLDPSNALFSVEDYSDCQAVLEEEADLVADPSD